MTKIVKKAKDGGPQSPVDAFFLVELKSLFSIALLRFNPGGREAYHTHAFNALTWFLWGDLVEDNFEKDPYVYRRSLLPKLTRRTDNHRVFANRTSWCLTLRGPWAATWTEDTVRYRRTFTWGRKVLKEEEITE